MKRFNTISNLPGLMSIVDYEDPVYRSDKPSVVDKKYFIPLSQQASGIFRSVDPKSFTLKDGVDDGRDISLRRRGLDLAERSSTLHKIVSDAAAKKADIENRIVEQEAIKSSKSPKEVSE